MFGFVFNNPKTICQIRGHEGRRYRDFCDHLLQNLIAALKHFLDPQAPAAALVRALSNKRLKLPGARK